MERRERTFYLVALLLALAVSTGCQKQERDVTVAEQEKAIESYMTTFGDTGKRVENIGGIMKGVIDEGTGEIAESEDTVIFSYAGYIFSSGPGTLFVTNNSTVATESGFPQMEYPAKECLGSGKMIEGLSKGLFGVREGEHCYLVFSAKYGYYNTVVYNVPKLSPLIFEIWVEQVKFKE